MDSKAGRLLKDTGVFALGSLGSKLILFLLVPLYTNFMSADEYGTADLVFTVAQLLVPAVSVVVYDAVLRFGLSRNERPQDVLLCGLAVCCVGGVAAVCAVPLLGLYGPVAEWRGYLVAYVVVTMLGNVEMNYLKARDKNGLYALLSVLQTALLALCSLAFVCWRGMGVAGYTLSMCIAGLVSVVGPLVWGGLAVDLRRARPDRALLRRMCLYSAPLVLNSLSWWGIQSADKLLVELFLGGTALGVFTVVTKVPSLINTFANVFAAAWGISAVREIEADRDTAFYRDVLAANQFVAFGACIAFVCVVKPFMGVYVGPGFGDCWRYVPLMLVGASLYAVALYYGSVYEALMKSVNNMATTLAGALTSVAVGWFAIPALGVWGAVASVWASYAVLAAVRAVDVNRYLPVGFGGPRAVLNVVIATAQALLVSLDWHGAAVSALACALFVAVNAPMFKKLLRR